jgi:hypothetical protein
MMKQPLLHQLGVSLRDSVCGVALFIPYGYYASVPSLDSLELTQNRQLGGNSKTILLR